MASENMTPGGVNAAQIPDPLGLGPVATEHRNEFPLGSRRLTKAGYIIVKAGTMERPAWVSEARLVISQHLGRELSKAEEIRHRHGFECWDNRLEALELWRNSRPARLPAPPRKPRTNWKRRYLELAKAVEEWLEIWGALDGEEHAAVQRIADQLKKVRSG